MKRKKYFILCLCCFFFLLTHVAALEEQTSLFQQGLVEINGEKFYINDNGTKHLGFKEIDGKLYFFSRWGGAMRTGTFMIDETLYSFDQDGVAVTGFIDYQNQRYYMNRGAAQTGFQVLNGKNYFFSRWGGAMRTGIFSIDGVDYGFNEDGTMMNGLSIYQGNTYYAIDGKIQTGFQVLNGKTYFFSRWGGAMRTGIFSIDGIDYGFNEDGTMMNGLSIYQGNTYYMPQGKMKTGFQVINGKTYFFSRWGGAMRTGIFEIDGKMYGFQDDGVMMHGMVNYHGATYYFNVDGTQHRGFKTVGNKLYFFSRIDGIVKTKMWYWVGDHKYYSDANGVVATGIKEIEGIEYRFNSLGQLQSGWVEGNGKTYFIDIYGNFVTDWHVIDGKKCFFNSLGELISRDAKYIIDVSKHQGTIDWNAVKNQGLVDGVILRVGFGSFTEDPMFARNVAELKRLGIPYGIYIFSYAENGTEAYNEAGAVLDMIRKYGLNPTLGIYYDIESWDLGYANSNNISMATYDTIITTFTKRLKDSGYRSYVYADLNYIRTRLSASMQAYVRWVAQYNHTCSYTGDYFMWQYSSSEHVSGINGNVDGNVWFN